MEFHSWNEVLRFYHKYMWCENVQLLYCVLARDDYNMLLGFIECFETGESSEKEFIAHLDFEPFIVFPELIMYGGLHFIPVKKFLKEEIEEMIKS